MYEPHKRIPQATRVETADTKSSSASAVSASADGENTPADTGDRATPPETVDTSEFGEVGGSLRRKAGRPRGIMLYGLKAARVEAELFANELSQKSGVNKSTVYRLEKLVTGADPLTIRKLCRALEVEPSKLRQPPEESPY